MKKLLLVLVFASCTQTDDGTIEPPPPEEDPATPDPMPTPEGETLAEASERVLDQFQDCMALADFQAANMASAWAKLPSTNSATCRTCHEAGGGGFIATENAQVMFDALKQNRYYLLQFVTVDLVNGAAGARVVVNRASFKSVALGQAPHQEHPRFDPDVNQGMTALQTFYDLTMQRIAGACAATPPPQ